MRVRIASAFLVLLGIAAPGLAQTSRLEWETSWKVAFERARAERRLVFIDFWASWCAPCMEMERRTFPDPRVIEQLQSFVLLKQNADLRKSGGALPRYTFVDPWETERLHFIGFRPPEEFAQKLALVAENAPAIVQASESLKVKESARGHLLLGQALFGARASTYARDELEAAAKLARREGDAAMAQIAETQAALIFVLEGKAPKALKLLEKIAASPANPECAASAWIAIGHVHTARQDFPAAAEAYRRALSVSPDPSPSRHDAEIALASLDERQ